MADKQYSVYYLADPLTNRVRYVGCSCRPFDRYLEVHLNPTDESHRARWVRQLAAAGSTPVLAIKCIVQSEEEMFRVEKALIAALRAKGERLTNMTDGGEGTLNISPEAQTRRTAASMGNRSRTGQPHSEATKKKMREARLKYNATHPEVVAEFAERSKGNKYGLGYRHTEEAKRRIAAAHLGNTSGSLITDAGREAKRQAMLGNTHSLGMKQTEESNARRSASLREYWARRKGTS